MMNSMMEETLLTGTARKAELPGWQAAGKTGTTQDWRDAWFVGYTSYLVAGVWLGNDDGTPTKKVSGGNLPVEIWSRFMKEAHQGVPAVRPAARRLARDRPVACGTAGADPSRGRRGLAERAAGRAGSRWVAARPRRPGRRGFADRRRTRRRFEEAGEPAEQVSGGVLAGRYGTRCRMGLEVAALDSTRGGTLDRLRGPRDRAGAALGETSMQIARRRRLGSRQAADHRDDRNRRPERRRSAGRGHGDGRLPHRRLYAVGRSIPRACSRRSSATRARASCARSAPA